MDKATHSKNIHIVPLAPPIAKEVKEAWWFMPLISTKPHNTMRSVERLYR